MSGSGHRPVAPPGRPDAPLRPLPAGIAVLARVAAALVRPRLRALSPRVSGAGRRFARDRAGASAVEFALLAAPFLALLGVVAESGIVSLEQLTLDIAVDRGGRLLRTGTFQDAADGSDPSQRFQKVICGGGMILFPCVNLRLDISRAASFTGSQPADPFDKTKKTWAPGFGTRFECPQGGDTVTVRVAVPVLRLFQVMDFTGRIMSDNSQMLISTVVFRAEDYETKSC